MYLIQTHDLVTAGIAAASLVILLIAQEFQRNRDYHRLRAERWARVNAERRVGELKHELLLMEEVLNNYKGASLEKREESVAS